MERTEPRGGVREYLCRYREILDTMIREMTCAELNGSISHNFIAQMIPHHRAAIQMSESLLKVSDYGPLGRIAENIIQEQTQSIARMEASRRVCGEVQNTEQELCRYARRFHQITQRMFAQMASARADCNVNADFMREMIPHHQGAIRMAKNALQYPICPELVPILEDIITSQEKGVEEMEKLLQCQC